MFLRIGIVLLALPAGLAAQAIVEYTLGTATAAGTAAAARRLGQTTADKIGKIHGATPAPPQTPKPLTASAPEATPASAASSAMAPRTARPAPEEPAAALPPITPAPAPAVSYEDPAGIKEGMDYAEVVRRFGPPSMKMSSSDAGGETLCYSRSGRDLDVQLRDGKVISIARTSASIGTIVLH